MPRTIQLLKQARHAAAAINQSTTNAEYKAILTAADYVFNELILQDSPAFYLDYIARGKHCLRKAQRLQ